MKSKIKTFSKPHALKRISILHFKILHSYPWAFEKVRRQISVKSETNESSFANIGNL